LFLLSELIDGNSSGRLEKLASDQYQLGAGVQTADKVLKGEKVQAKYPVDLKLVIKQ
jgi:ABC-type sugar transport system substrate-binding protein